MRFEVPYGKGAASFETDAPCKVADIACPACREPGDILSQAIEHPVGGPSFREFASSCKGLMFILCDATRPTPTAQVLELLVPLLDAGADFGLIVATGSHRAPTDAEYRSMLGSLHDTLRPRTVSHDSRDPAANIRVGTTSRGTPVSFDRAVLDADGIVTINSVEPHYFAGFTGGRKSFLPGVAGYDTIERNHSHACEPGALPMSLDGNPVSEDMQEAAGILSGKSFFSIQTVMAPDGKLHSAFAGEPGAAFSEAVRSARDLFSVRIPRLANIVVTVAPPPMDSNLYQSQKALEHGRLALEKGGVMILVSSCWDGIGDRGFYDMLSGFKDGDKVDDYMGENYKLGNHKAARMLALCEHAGAILAVTSLDDDVLRPARMTGFGSLQGAVDEAVRFVLDRGLVPEIIVLPGGSMAVPTAVGP